MCAPAGTGKGNLNVPGFKQKQAVGEEPWYKRKKTSPHQNNMGPLIALAGMAAPGALMAAGRKSNSDGRSVLGEFMTRSSAGPDGKPKKARGYTSRSNASTGSLRINQT